MDNKAEVSVQKETARMSCAALKKALVKRIGEDVFYFSEVMRLVRHHIDSNHPAESTVRTHLQKSKLHITDYGIKSDDYGLAGASTVYPRSEVWRYLREIAVQREIPLEGMDETNFDEPLKLGQGSMHYAPRSRHVNRSIPRKWEYE